MFCSQWGYAITGPGGETHTQRHHLTTTNYELQAQSIPLDSIQIDKGKLDGHVAIMPVLPVDAQHVEHHGGAHAREDGRGALLVLEVRQLLEDAAGLAEDVVGPDDGRAERLPRPFDVVLEQLRPRVAVW